MLNHADIMNCCDTKRYQLGFEVLTDTERVITLVSSANFEIENGSVSQFYANSAGDNAVETVWALNQIQAYQAARGLEKTNALLSASGAYPRDRNQRSAVLDSLPDNAFDAFHDAYYADGDPWTMLCEYIDVHEQDLRDCGLLTS